LFHFSFKIIVICAPYINKKV